MRSRARWRRRCRAYRSSTCDPSAPISASTDRVAALVVDALAAPPDPGLDEHLGAAGATALRAALRERALRWAAASGPAFHAEVADAGAALAALDGHAGPVLLAAPDVPGLDERLAAAALADLRAGVGLAMAPATDGRPFLLALARADSELVAQASLGLPDREAVARLAGGEFGLLRSERRLVSAGDARAFAADPLTPPELAALLRPGS